MTTKLALKFGNYGNQYLLEEQVDPNEPNAVFSSSSTPTDIINAIIPYVFVVAGLILLGLLIMGGFQLMTSAGDPKKTEAGKGKIVSGIIGFLIIFLAYWIAQAVGIMLGFNLLSG